MEQYGKGSIYLKKTKRVSQKKKKSKKVNIVVEQSSLPQIQLKMMEPIIFLCNINNGFSLKNSGGHYQFSTEFLR